MMKELFRLNHFAAAEAKAGLGACPTERVGE